MIKFSILFILKIIQIVLNASLFQLFRIYLSPLSTSGRTKLIKLKGNSVKVQCYQKISAAFQLIIFLQAMDIEEFIKIEEPNYNDAELTPHYFPHDFYDQESEVFDDRNGVPVEQIILQASQLEGFIDMPVDQVVKIMAQQYNLELSHLSLLRRRVRKTKNIMKRNRAKGRKTQPEQVFIPERKVLPFEESSMEKETQEFQKQIKKQKNRISAQISRDRKKNYMSILEKTNKQLEEETDALKRQNDELKKLLEEKNGATHKKKVSNNKFMKLLVMLGLIFFIYIMQDVFNFNFKLNKNKGVIESEQVKSQIDMNNVAKSDGKQVMEEIKNEINFEFLEQGEKEGSFMGFGVGFKDLVGRKISQLHSKTREFTIPRHLLSTIMQAKSCI